MCPHSRATCRCSAGSLRALAVHPQLPILASVGLDRFLRLHDTRTRQPLAKVYLKQQLTGVLPGRWLQGQQGVLLQESGFGIMFDGMIARGLQVEARVGGLMHCHRAGNVPGVRF